MGYYTKHELKVVEGDVDLIRQLREESEGAQFSFDDDGETEESTKWYDHDKDMIEFSTKHPEALFELTGDGEESPDFWRTYYKNGKYQTCKGEIVYEKFDPKKLG